MLVPLSLLAIVGFLQTNADLPATSMGSVLYEECKNAIRLRENPNSDTSLEAIGSAECVNYLSGFVDGLSDKSICLDHYNEGTLARVYVVFMDTHPKYLDEHKAQGLLFALRDAYPCPSKRSQ
jgi:hypothetical protein